MDGKYFKHEEFACPCCGVNEIKDALILRLDRVRERYGHPMKVNSGYRCSKHNEELGGKSDSAHLAGWAADISVADNHERFLLIASAIATQEFLVGFVRIEANVGKGWVHLDMDPGKPQETMF
jgi:zinc D-Ala-D-Ala carboxypeptidase